MSMVKVSKAIARETDEANTPPPLLIGRIFAIALKNVPLHPVARASTSAGRHKNASHRMKLRLSSSLRIAAWLPAILLLLTACNK